MDREYNVVELGVASRETQGGAPQGEDIALGQENVGLSDD